jgi:hypothetical protein
MAHEKGVFIILCQSFDANFTTQMSGSESLFREWA